MKIKIKVKKIAQALATKYIPILKKCAHTVDQISILMIDISQIFLQEIKKTVFSACSADCWSFRKIVSQPQAGNLAHARGFESGVFCVFKNNRKQNKSRMND